MPHSTSKSIFLAPSPRIVSDIFDENDLLRLRGVGEVVIHEGGPVTVAEGSVPAVVIGSNRKPVPINPKVLLK